MSNFDISVQRFNEFSKAYAVRFDDVSAYSKYLDVFCNVIKASNPHILELACGPGNVTKYLDAHIPNASILATDLAPKMLEIGKKQLPHINFQLLDARAILTLDNTFDAIMCSFCLPFLSQKDAEKLIGNCAEKLNANGVLYISTMEGDTAKAGFENTSFSGEAQVYFNYHKQEDLQNALKRNGFVIELEKKQNYLEADGSVSVDMIFVARKLV